MTPDDVRAIALALDGATERDHHGFPSFRRRTIFATLPQADRLHVLMDEGSIRDAVAESPGWCVEKWWGKRLSAVQVDLAVADPGIVAELIADAWGQHG